MFKGVRIYGWRQWLSQTLNDPVYFVFPILTSISFYGEATAVVPTNGVDSQHKNRKEHKNEDLNLNQASETNQHQDPSTSKQSIKREKETESTKSCTGSTEQQDPVLLSEAESDDCENNVCVIKKVNLDQEIETLNLSTTAEPTGEMLFSFEQSNVLYVLFILGSSFCLFADIYHQRARGKD